MTWALLRRPKWIAAHIMVLAIAGVFVLLGLWQLDRLSDRQESNRLVEESLAGPRLELLDIDWENSDYTPIVGTALPAPDKQLLQRSQVWLGLPGFHVITPMTLGDNTAVLVDRGWIPLDAPPLSTDPEQDPVEIVGYIRLPQKASVFTPEDPSEGPLDVIVRVDPERLTAQTGLDLLPGYVVLTESVELAGEPLAPIPKGLPTLDSGSHLSYAIQWFSFAAVAIGGYLAIIRRAQPAANRAEEQGGTTSP